MNRPELLVLAAIVAAAVAALAIVGALMTMPDPVHGRVVSVDRTGTVTD